MLEEKPKPNATRLGDNELLQSEASPAPKPPSSPLPEEKLSSPKQGVITAADLPVKPKAGNEEEEEEDAESDIAASDDAYFSAEEEQEEPVKLTSEKKTSTEKKEGTEKS